MKLLLLRSSMAVEKCDSVCVCLSTSIPQEHTTPKLYQILSCVLPGALVWSSSGSDAICCVLLILWMTSCDVVKVTQKRGGCICIHCTVYSYWPNQGHRRIGAESDIRDCLVVTIAGSWRQRRRSCGSCRSWWCGFSKVPALMLWWNWSLSCQLLSLWMSPLPLLLLLPLTGCCYDHFYYPCDAMLALVQAMALCPCLCLSVASRCSIETG